MSAGSKRQVIRTAEWEGKLWQRVDETQTPAKSYEKWRLDTLH
jgi:hypothetical protein